MNLLKKLRKLRVDFMAKNGPKKGRSARNGNAPSPYTKHKKTPWRYSAGYYQWRSDRLARRNTVKKDDWKANNRTEIRDYKMAAE